LYRFVTCMFAGCGKRLLQHDFSPGVAPRPSHSSTCDFKPVLCDFPGGACVTTVLRKDMDKHHQEGTLCVFCVCFYLCL
jgi:hypothetical protein